MHASGIPATALHLMPGDGAVGALLVAHPLVAGIAFTGSTAAARAINRALAEKDAPLVPLIAETGGVNAMIVDATALPEQVADDVVTSSFRSAGQRCSALRLLCLQEDVADRILEVVAGAASELTLGDPRDPAIRVGPVIDLEGLMRIKGYVGKLPTLASFPAAAEALKRRFGSLFPKWSDDDWLAFARATFKEDGGRLVPDYDPKLATILEAIGPEQPLPALWKEFDALGRVPVMVIRGANSDILSAATVEAMRKRRRALEVLEVPEEGHAPRLAGVLTIERIAGFIASCDATGSGYRS